jgi:hypothetical protein
MNPSNCEEFSNVDDIVDRTLGDIDSLALLRGMQHVVAGMLFELNQISSVIPVRKVMLEALASSKQCGYSCYVSVKSSDELRELFDICVLDLDLRLYVIAEFFSRAAFCKLALETITDLVDEMPIKKHMSRANIDASLWLVKEVKS